MEELVIRFGATEGPRGPTSDDVRKALEDVESWVHQREEFSIEKVSNWRPEVIDGRRVIRCVMEPPYATAAIFYIEGNSIPIGWFVTFHAQDSNQFALAASVDDKAEYIDGICYGGPFMVRKDCLVPVNVAHDALTYFATLGDRSPNHSWVNWKNAVRLPK